MEGIMLIYLICYIDMTLTIVYEDPTENCHGKFGSLIKYYYYYDNHHHHFIINYIIVMIILWLKLYFFTIEVELVLQAETIHRRRAE